MDFKNSIEDLEQIFTLGIRYGGPNKTRNIRYIYAHKSDLLLDMREDKDFKIFDEIFPDRLKKAFAILLSHVPKGKEGREYLQHFPIYEQDLGQFGTLENWKIIKF